MGDSRQAGTRGVIGRGLGADSIERHLARFWPKVRKYPGDGCWEWIASLYANGYGAFSVDGVKVFAHRAAYELLVAPIGPGLTVDHLCPMKACVNPAHMEIVTHGENGRRANLTRRIYVRMAACKRGHEFTDDNVYVDGRGERHCRTCRRNRRKESAALISHHPTRAEYAKRWIAQGLDDRSDVVGIEMREVAAGPHVDADGTTHTCAAIDEAFATARGALVDVGRERDEARARIDRWRQELVDYGNDALNMRGILSPAGSARRVPMDLGKELAPIVAFILDERDAARAELAKAESALADANTMIGSLGSQLDHAKRERDSLARRCSVRFEEGEKLRADRAKALAACDAMMAGTLSPSGIVAAVREALGWEPSAETATEPAATADGDAVNDAAWLSIWLHGNWSWLTQKMTTPEREHAADAVERQWARNDAADGEETSYETRVRLRWWCPVPSPGKPDPMAVACPTCGAPANSWCKGADILGRIGPHEARYLAAGYPDPSEPQPAVEAHADSEDCICPVKRIDDTNALQVFPDPNCPDPSCNIEPGPYIVEQAADAVETPADEHPRCTAINPDTGHRCGSYAHSEGACCYGLDEKWMRDDAVVTPAGQPDTTASSAACKCPYPDHHSTARVYHHGDDEPAVGTRVKFGGNTWLRHPRYRWVVDFSLGTGSPGIDWDRLTESAEPVGLEELLPPHDFSAGADDNVPCCDLHNRRCEAPADMCCAGCTETKHIQFPYPHADGSPCAWTAGADDNRPEARHG